MKVILIKKVEKLGNPGEEKEVKDGYARNYLLRNDLAVLPGDIRAKEIIMKKNVLKEEKKGKDSELQELAEKASLKKISYSVKADKQGKLYGSIGPKEMATSTGIPEKYFKTHYKKIGQYNEDININGFKTNIKIEINKKE